MDEATRQVVEAFDQLFAGRRDIYAEGYLRRDADNKYRYVKVAEPLTHTHLYRHLKGELTVGVYPITLDNTVSWFAVDFDGGEQAWEQARAVRKTLTGLGLFTYLERSRSGTGVHLWGFLTEPMPAAIVRQAVMPYVPKTVVTDKRYPNQDELRPDDGGKGAYGNLIALPFSGKAVPEGNSMFLDDQEQPIPVRTFLKDVRKNVPAVIERIASKAPRVVPKTAGPAVGTIGAPGEVQFGQTKVGALKVLSSYGCTFFRHCYTDRATLPEPEWYAAIQISTHFEQGRDLAHIVSMDGKRYNAYDVDAKFDQALANPRVGCQYIHENFPEHACAGCPMKAPHWLAEKRVLSLCGSTKAAPMRRAGSAKTDLDRVRAYEAGARASGIRWGIPGLDQYTQLRPSEYVAIGARPSMGKTQLMIDGMVRIARQGVRVFAFSAETGEEAFRNRLLGRLAQVDTRMLRAEGHRKLRSDEWARLERASDELDRLPIYIDYTSVNADAMLEQIEGILLRERVPLDEPLVVFFDYLQYGHSQDAHKLSRYELVSQLSKEFKYLGKIIEQPTVVLSQVKRENEGDDEPDLGWFKESGGIEQDLETGIIITGCRTQGERAARILHIVKQKEAESNINIPMRLNQTYGEWEYADAPASPSHGPLFTDDE